MSFPSYPEYKDSGVEWLGEVPEHWETKPLKRVATYNDEVLAETTADNHDLKYVEISDVDEQRGITGWSEHTFATAPSRARRRLRHGDVLISTVRTYLRAIAPVIKPPENLIGSTGFAAIRSLTGQYDSALMGYTLRAEWFISKVIANSVGVSYPAINATDLTRFHVPVPPLPEQTQIAAFLDHETAKIDALIREQKRLIALLKEKRQAVISHAVTKGIDPAAPMKDSGVEWLGEVPAHWEVPRLKHISYAQGGGTPSKEREDYWVGDIPWVSPKDMKSYVIKKTVDCISQEAVDDSGLKLIPFRSVLVVVRGMILAHSFPVALSGLSVTINQDMKALTPAAEKLSPEYLQLLLCGIDEVVFDCVGSSAHGTKKLEWEYFFRIRIPLPQPDEQFQIVSQVQGELQEIDQLTSQAKIMADTLSERRSALISAAVTGKIDVRGWVPPADAALIHENTTCTEAV